MRGTLVSYYSLSPDKESHLWARGGLAQARKAHISERSQNLPGASVASSPKRESVA